MIARLLSNSNNSNFLIILNSQVSYLNIQYNRPTSQGQPDLGIGCPKLVAATNCQARAEKFKNNPHHKKSFFIIRSAKFINNKNVHRYLSF